MVFHPAAHRTVKSSPAQWIAVLVAFAIGGATILFSQCGKHDAAIANATTLENKVSSIEERDKEHLEWSQKNFDRLNRSQLQMLLWMERASPKLGISPPELPADAHPKTPASGGIYAEEK